MDDKKKYIIILGDGMSDRADEHGKTPLMYARKPDIDALAARGELGLCRTVPKGMKPGSDNANLSVLGYDPLKYYTGRSPLEAVSMGIKLADTDITYRCNLVTLSEDEPYSKKRMIDYSSGEITNAEAAVLIKFLSERLGLPEEFGLFNGVSYRHCLVMHGGAAGAQHTPPHDITDKPVTEYLPKGANAALFLSFMEKSYGLLKDHPVNLDRKKRGLNPANSIWLWGEGKKPVLPEFFKKFGKAGAMISAVDLLKGIAISAGMKVCDVPGATGNLDTDYEGKAAAALKVLDNGCDFVYVHVEATDECGHHGDLAGKIKGVEYLNDRIVKPISTGLSAKGYDFSMLILPDHATPVKLKTHTPDPVPYILYRSYAEKKSGFVTYNEDSCAVAGNIEDEGYKLILKLFEKA